MMRTARLDLVPATLEIVTADLHCRDELPALLSAKVGAGWPPPLINVEAMLRIKESFAEGDPQGWSSYYIVERSANVLIGLAGFKTKPVEGAVEFGYTLLPDWQRLGLGTEVVGAMAEWALSQPEVSCVFAETLPELTASQRVLEKNGFGSASNASEPGVIRFERRRADAKRRP